jgi:hypothetical protein
MKYLKRYPSEAADATNNNADTTDEVEVPNKEAAANHGEGIDSFDLDKSIDDGVGGSIKEKARSALAKIGSGKKSILRRGTDDHI